jgi:hypothetical protein
MIILNIFAKNLAFFTQNKAELGKNWIATLVFEKHANFLLKIAENCQQLPKIAGKGRKCRKIPKNFGKCRKMPKNAKN